MLDGLKLRSTTLGNIEVEDRRSEIGVNCILLSRGPECKATFGLRNNPTCVLALTSCQYGGFWELALYVQHFLPCSGGAFGVDR